MATMNPFDLLVDADNDDPSQLAAKLPPVAAAAAPGTKKSPAQAASVQPAPAKLPSKPLPPAQAVREGRTDGPRGGGRFGGRGRGGGAGRGFNRDDNRGFNRDDNRGFSRDDNRGFNRDDNRGFNRDDNRGLVENENSFGGNNGFSGGYPKPSEDGDIERPSERRGFGGPHGGYRGGRRGGYSNGELVEGERPRRVFERRSGTGRGNEFKRDGAGRGNWGTPTDEAAPETEEPANETERDVEAEKSAGQEEGTDNNKDESAKEGEEKEPEEKEMTLEEYEKVLEEKRKALLALKSEERKVCLDKDFESMQLLSSKKSDTEVLVKLGSEKDKRKEAVDKEEKTKKSVSINEFLKPAEGERLFSGGRGRGRGRGRGPRAGGFNEGGEYGGNRRNNEILIKDDKQFPSLGVK